MTESEFNKFCASLPHTQHVVQWGGAQVWKITSEDLFVTFKCSPMSYELLKNQPGLRPAPYLASRGMKWIQRTGPEIMDDATLQDYIKASYKLVALGLPKKTQKELGWILER